MWNFLGEIEGVADFFELGGSGVADFDLAFGWRALDFDAAVVVMR